MSIPWLDPGDPSLRFPPVEKALTEPDGLLAAGGDLRPQRLLEAYRQGIFPWFEAGQPILWWSPNPRMVLIPEHLRITRSLRKTVRNKPWRISFNQAFRQVISNCAGPRQGSHGTWITDDMHAAYNRLHKLGYASSVEVWDEKQTLIGGLYGVSIGRMYFGESMFSHRRDASKVAMVHLASHLRAWGFPMIDCQLASEHLISLGAEPMPRLQFRLRIDDYCRREPPAVAWRFDASLDPLSRP